MAVYHQTIDVPSADLSVRATLPDRQTRELRVCVEVGNDLSIYLTEAEWASVTKMADAAFRVSATRYAQDANQQAGGKS